MSKAEKLLSQMKTNPRDWRIEDLVKVADRFGIHYRRPSGGGSHVIFESSVDKPSIAVPDHRPIKPIYIKKFLGLVDSARGK